MTKKIEIGILITIGLGITTFFGVLIHFFIYYNEAEPLVQIVWPMADDIEAFMEENGRRPVSLEEVDRQSATDLKDLKNYRYRFFSEGRWIFHMTVNKKYGFGIDEEFRPLWTGAEPDTEQVDARNGEKPAGGERLP